MAKEIDITINSKIAHPDLLYQMASGHISQTAILFEKENVVAVIEAKGSAAFYDMDDTLIAAGTVPPIVNGKEVYQEIGCQVENNQLTLKFPKYTWIDNYPHCDGEHDRWDTRIIGFHTLTLDLSTGTIV